MKKQFCYFTMDTRIWSDGTKTVVKCQDDDWYDPEKGLAMAISKKALGNKGNYCNEIKKWLPNDVTTIACGWADICPMTGHLQEAYTLLKNIQDGKYDPSKVEEVLGSLGELLED